MRTIDRMVSSAFCWIILFVGSTESTPAQVISGAVEGTVTDQSGSVVPGVEIVALHRETGSKRTIITNEGGYYRIDQLPIGAYELTASLSGFKTASTNSISVTLGSPITVNIQLQVGEVSEKVIVEGTAPQIQLSSNELERNLSEIQLGELPVIDRDPSKLLQLYPGVPVITQDKNGSLTVGGLRPRSTVYNVDGSNNNSFISSGMRTPVILDAIGEMRAVTNVYSAQYGRGAGAVVDSVMKSGTNQFHGSLYEYYRGTALNANDFFANARGLGKTQFVHNQYGANIGGPFVRNRAFFFGAFEGANSRTRGIELATVPSDAIRTLELTNPLSLAKDPVVSSLITQVFALLPPCSSTVPSCNFSSLQHNNSNIYMGTAKLDYLITSKDTLSGRMIVRSGDSAATSILASRLGVGEGTVGNYATTYRRLFSPKVINEAIFTINSVEDSSQVPNAKLPDISISGYSGIGASSNQPQSTSQRYYQIVNNFSVGVSNHNIKAGADIMWVIPKGYAEFSGRGIYQFIATPNPQLGANDALTNFRMGRAYQFQQGTGDFRRRFAYLDMGLYFQDDWKVSRNLTANLGVRYDVQGSPKITGLATGVEVYEAFDPKTRQFTNWKTGKKNISPSVGFAWDPTGKGLTVIRGGYRRSYDRIPNDFYNIGAILQAPLVKSFLAQLPAVTVIPLGKGQDAAKEAGLAVSLMLTPDCKLANAHTWHLSVQRQVMKDTVVEIGYLGTAGRDLGIAVSYNRINPDLGRRPDPTLSMVTLVDDIGYSDYHGLTSMIRRQFRSGLAFTAAYTWSKALDVNHDAVAPFGGELGGQVAVAQDASDQPILSLEHGRAIFDRSHAFASSLVWQTPKLTQNRLAGGLLNGWQVSALAYVQTGNPYTVLAGVDLNGDGINNDRPDLVDTGILGSLFNNPNSPMPRAAFNGATQPRRIGNLGRNTFRRDGVVNVDSALVKRFPIPLRERMVIEFRCEFFNTFNTARFGPPVSTLTSASFGQVQSAENEPRRIRFALKLSF